MLRQILVAILVFTASVVPGWMCSRIHPVEHTGYTLWINEEPVYVFSDFAEAKRVADLWAENYDIAVKVTWDE